MYLPRLLEVPQDDILLRKYIDVTTEEGKKIIRHSNAVSMLALDLGLMSVFSGVPCNLEFVYTSAKLHDIGKYKKTKKDMHMFIGKKLLEKEGYPQHGRVAGVHGLAKEAAETYHILGDFEPRSLEEKVVVLADFCIVGDKVLTVDQRFDCLKKTFLERGLNQRVYHLDKSIPRIKTLEKELKTLWEKNVYLDYIRRFEARMT